MNKDYIDSVKFIRKSERDDYNRGVEREYDVYLDGDIVWAKFRPNLTYRVRVSKNQFTKYVLNFEKSCVYLIPSKKDKDETIVTYQNLYINNLDGEVILDYQSTGSGKIEVNDYLGVSVKCDSIVIRNCDNVICSNLFVGIVASNMKFENCNIECLVKGNYMDDIDNIIVDNSSIVCKIDSFVSFHKMIVDSGSLIFESNREVNLYARNILLNSAMLGFKSLNSSRVVFKYLEAVDSKINSSNSGISIYGVKKASLVNSVLGNTAYNNDITITCVDRDKSSVIYNNISERDSMSYTGFIERYRGEVRGMYLSGKLSEFEYNKILDDLDKFLLFSGNKKDQDFGVEVNFMKKFIRECFIILYFLLVVFVTACLLSYNEYGVTVFGDKALVIADDNKIQDTSSYDLIIIDTKYDDLNIGDSILYYNPYNGTNEVVSDTIKSIDNSNIDFVAYTLSNNVTIDSKNIVGLFRNAKIYPIVGGILSFLESKWGYLIVVVLPILLAFIYELYAIICEFGRKQLICMKLSKKDIKFNKKVIFILILFLVAFFSIGMTFGRYAYKHIRDFYLMSKKFYFNSDMLDVDSAYYEIDNWSGVDTYSITINMNSLDNNRRGSEVDIAYDIQFTCSSNIICESVDDKSSGVIYQESHTDDFTINMTPREGVNLEDGDSIWLEVTTKSTSPYKKTLSGKFVIVVGMYGLAYEIDDSVNSPYLEVRITNTLDYYKVIEAFDNYQIGDKIDISTYQNLSDTDKLKCTSSVIHLSFDPRYVLLDMTSHAYLNRYTIGTTTMDDGYEYVNDIIFGIDALSSYIVKFYKVDDSIDYTYPLVNDSSIVTVSFEQEVIYEL